MNIYEKISSSDKKIAVLIDPDKLGESATKAIASKCVEAGVDLLFVGGSLLTNDGLEACIRTLKENCGIPVLIFPGDPTQISPLCDAFLLLSVISGRNAEMLIGRHVVAAPRLKSCCKEIIPTGYILIDGGCPTSVSYMSGTIPIPHDKDDIAVCTAIAGEMLGLKMMYLEAGSGAAKTVSESMITKVKRNIGVPLAVGGGITSPEKAYALAAAGADIIVVGTAFEKNADIKAFADAVHRNNTLEVGSINSPK